MTTFQELVTALMNVDGSCKECRMGIEFHHSNCPIGRLVNWELWERLKKELK